MREYHLIIDGEKVGGEEGSFGVKNPATEEVFANCPSASDAQLDLAVKSADEAFQTWSKVSDEKRSQLLLAVAQKIEENANELATLIVKEQGKPKGLADIEIGASIAWINYTASLQIPVETIEDSDERTITMYRKPLGVVGSITPWNWPFMIAIWHILPALKAGNTLVCKPSSNTPLSTLVMVELMNEVLPKGVINILAGGSALGSKMSKHEGIRKIAFTGSTETGKSIMDDSSDTLKRLTLELGGNDAAIVLPNTQNLDDLIPKIFQGSFLNMGQTCAAIKRLYVHEDQYEEVCEKLVAVANAQVVGDGLQEGVTFGPLQNKAQLDFVKELVEDAKQNGGTVLCGGGSSQESGYFYDPTIISNVDNSFRIVSEEQFGPVLPVVKYSTLEEAIKMANDSDVGLGGSVWGDAKEAEEVALELECGTSWVNVHAEVLPHSPFGGCKLSGYGVEFGQEGLLEFTRPHVVNVSKLG